MNAHQKLLTPKTRGGKMKSTKLLSMFTAALLSGIMILAGCGDQPNGSADSGETKTDNRAPEPVVSGIVKFPPVRVRKAPKVELIIQLPKVASAPTPVPVNEPNIAPLRAKGLKRPVIKVPVGTVNLALGKPVSSNESLPLVGDLDWITDAQKSGEDGFCVDLGFGKKWVQIDLGARANIYGVSVWHYHRSSRAYRDVIVEVADDVDFTENVQITFNSDHDNSYGKGIGQDMGYVETNEGKYLYCPKGTVGRYVRLHSQGNTSNDQNHYTEVEVYGIPIK
jgi:hypothetical protein